MLSNYRTYGLKPMLRSMVKRDDWDAIRKVDVLFVDHDGHRSYRYRGKAYAPLIDSLQERYLAQGKRCMTIAEPFSQLTGDAAFGHVVDLNGSLGRAAVRRLVANRFAQPERVTGVRYLRDVWLEVLRRAKPSEIVAIQPAQALCSAARSLGIEVYDFQHGVITESHPWYGSSFRRDYPVEGLPTGFLCWDDDSARVLEQWAPPMGISVRVVGNPWTQRFVDRDPADTLVSDAAADSEWLRDLPPNRVLVTLAWGFDVITDPGMPHFLSFPIPLADVVRETAGKAVWFLRPHPVQVNGAEGPPLYRFLEERFAGLPNVFWSEVATTPLPVLLGETNLHLTVGSTVTSEAAVFGISTGLIVPRVRPKGYLDDYFLPERESGIAEFVLNEVDSLRQYLRMKLPDVYGNGHAAAPSSPR